MIPFPPRISEASPAPAGRRSGRRVAALAFALSATLAACGGGVGELAGVGTGGTGSFSVGPITGFGSVIVNGVRFDDSAARVSDDEGNRVGREALRLGMVVEVRGTVGADRSTGTANEVVFGSEIKGPVTAVDAAGGTLTVFGQPVRVTSRTVFEDISGGLSGVSVGNVVEVYALVDADGRFDATRIERESRTVVSFGGEFRVRGPVRTLTGSGDARRFVVSSVTVTTDPATRIDGTLRDGGFVSVRLGPTPAADGSYRALRVQARDRGFGDDIGEAEIEGLVSGFTDANQTFRVNGFPVRLGTSVVFEDGVRGNLANGVPVEVEGSIVGGVLVARKVEFEDDRDDDDSPFEFEGVAACVSCGAGEGTFTVRGVTLRYDARTRFTDGASPANLNGLRVDVDAVARSGADGTNFLATRIEQDD